MSVVRLLPLAALLAAAPAPAPPTLAQSADAPSAVAPAAATSLAEAVAAIRARRKLDLTRAFDAATPMPRGFAPPRIAPAVDPRTLEALTIARDGERATYYGFAGPAGTHVEAPAAVSADGAALDAIPADEMLLPLVVIDATALPAADPPRDLSPADLAAHETKHGRIPSGAFVALRTASVTHAPTGGASAPGWSVAVLKLLFEERGAVAVGQDGMGMARGASAYALGHGHWLLAGLDRLDAVPATGAAIMVSWPRVANGFAFPARAIAVLP